MSLKRLTKQAMSEPTDGRIILVHYDAGYLTELCDTYDCLDRIAWIADANVRSQGKKSFRRREIEVRGLETLDNMRPEDLIIITDDYYRESYEAVRMIAGSCTAEDAESDQGNIFFFPNKETTIDLTYRERYRDSSLRDMILFRSGPHGSAYVYGMDFSDNARALFEYMLHEQYNRKYRLVWMVKDPEDVLFDAYRNMPGVEFVSFDWSATDDVKKRDRYYETLCLSKYIFFTDAYGFARNSRPDQIRVQLWHGNGYKTRVNFTRCECRYEYTTVNSEIYQKIHAEVYGLRMDQILITGLAKQDWLFSPSSDWKERMRIPVAKKMVFWLPTFRSATDGLTNLSEYELGGQTGLPVLETPGQMWELNTLLAELDVILVIKLHPFQNRACIAEISGDRIVLLDNETLVHEDLQINQILGDADALISDYSSAAVDYMLLDRPIAFTLDDVEAYEASRGFVFSPVRDWMPGSEIYRFEDFCDFVRAVAGGRDPVADKRRMLIGKMHAFHDGHNCERIMKTLGWP